MECSSKEMSGVEEIFDVAVTMAVGEVYKEAETGRISAIGSSSKKPKRSKCRIL